MVGVRDGSFIAVVFLLSMTFFVRCDTYPYLSSVFLTAISEAKILSWINLKRSLGSIIVAQKATGGVGLVVTIVRSGVSK